MGDSSSAFNAVELEVFAQLLSAAAEEMGVRLQRSALSPNIKERRDFSCAIFDARGDTVAQAAHIPVHLGSMDTAAKAVLDAFGVGEMRPGDRFIVNDPYAGGTHLPDVTLIEPVWLHDEPAQDAPPDLLLGSRAHHADVGGETPGSLPLSTHIDQEGVRLPPTRLTDEMLDDFANATRTPDERRGDLLAQTASLQAGGERLRQLTEEHGRSRLLSACSSLQDYVARLASAEITRLPDGVFLFVDVLDDDGHGNTDIAIVVELTIDGDRLTFNLRNSAPQVAGPLNTVRAVTRSAAAYVLRLLLSGDAPANAGLLRGVTLLTTPGTVVDAEWPAPVAAGNIETSQRITDAMLGALAQAARERFPAASAGTMNNITIGSPPGRVAAGATPPWAYYETLAGGAGASPNSAGGDAVQVHMTNTLNTPVEALEHAYPMRIERYAIRRATGGAGQRSGGDGVVRVYRFLESAVVTLLTERRTNRPWGLAGGEPGASGVNRISWQGGAWSELPGKCSVRVEAGDRIEIATPGGGGYGPTVTRPER